MSWANFFFKDADQYRLKSSINKLYSESTDPAKDDPFEHSSTDTKVHLPVSAVISQQKDIEMQSEKGSCIEPPHFNVKNSWWKSRLVRYFDSAEKWYYVLLSPGKNISAIPLPTETIEQNFKLESEWFYKLESKLLIRQHGWCFNFWPGLVRFAKRRRSAAFWGAQTLFLAVWIALFVILVVFNRYRALVYDSDSSSWVEPQVLDCYSYLSTSVDSAGINGSNLMPFVNATAFYRCPALCAYAAPTNYRFLGLNVVPANKPWIVGSNPFRADSYMCQSAMKLGLISNSFGGCFQLSETGAQTNFPDYLPGSLAFNSWFPFSYTLSSVSSKHCVDFGPTIMTPVIFVISALWVVFLRPTRGLLYTFQVVVGYLLVLYFVDTLWTAKFIATGLGNLISTLFIVYVLYIKFGGASVLPMPLFSPFEIAVLWLPFFYFGLTINLWTIDLVNFTISADMFNNTRNTVAFFIGLPVLIILVCCQLVVLWRQARLVVYALTYGLGIGFFFLLAAITNTYTHWHHWFNSILLFPLTNIRWKLSLITQAFVLGMFLNGVARWGFDTPLEAYAVSLNDPTPVGASYPYWTFTSSQFMNSSSDTYMTLTWRFFVNYSPLPDWISNQVPPNDPSNPGVIVSPQYNTTTFCQVTSIYPNQWLKAYSLTANGIEIYRGPDCFFNLSNSILPTTSIPYYFSISFVSVDNQIMGYSMPLAGNLNNGSFFTVGNNVYVSYF